MWFRASVNEMYGWDSYFIVRGLLRAGRVELARGMIDNFFFEIEHYGAMLNANRTYYLTGSQPPFLSSMFVNVYDALQKAGTPILPGWRWPMPTWKRITTCGTATLMGPVTPDCRVTTYFGEGIHTEAMQDETGSTARSQPTFSFIPRSRMATFSKACLEPRKQPRDPVTRCRFAMSLRRWHARVATSGTNSS